MLLVNLLDTNLELKALINDKEALLTKLNEKNIEIVDTTEYTSKALVKKFGQETARIMLGGFQIAAKQDPLMDQMYISLATIGLNFADDEVVLGIDSLISIGVWGENSSVIGNSLKSIGKWNESIIQRYGVAQQDITSEELDIAVIEVTRREFQRAISAKFNIISESILDGRITSIEEVKELLG